MIGGIPNWVFWAAGWAGLILGALTVLAGDRLIRCLRWWLVRQMRMVRSPRYRTMLRWNGWALLVCGALLLVLLGLHPAR